jgi:hypothetical protein
MFLPFPISDDLKQYVTIRKFWRKKIKEVQKWNVKRKKIYLANNFDRFDFRTILHLWSNNFLFLVRDLINLVNAFQRDVILAKVPENENLLYTESTCLSFLSYLAKTLAGHFT